MRKPVDTVQQASAGGHPLGQQLQPSCRGLKWNDSVASWNVRHVSIPEEHKRSLRLWNNTVTHNKPRPQLSRCSGERCTLFTSVTSHVALLYPDLLFSQRYNKLLSFCMSVKAFIVKALQGEKRNALFCVSLSLFRVVSPRGSFSQEQPDHIHRVTHFFLHLQADRYMHSLIHWSRWGQGSCWYHGAIVFHFAPQI